ncbi:MAG: outer rane usher protein [Hyphomicrobiales bacterium]|jgi:outer membrane usher protein|nr:outer rane usher protein [Hyphomicrobiales bacterium]
MPARAEDAGRAMQLEVILNGTPTKLIGAFTMLEGNRLAATRQELLELGLNPRGYASPGDLVVLDQVFGLSHKYDETTQRILITAPEEQLAVKEYNLRTAAELTPAQSDWGGIVNYNFFASGVSNVDGRPIAINGVPLAINGIPTKFTGAPMAFNGASATFDARVFTPFGTISQSAILRTASLTDRFDALRLNTTLTYSDPETMMSYRAGDVITGGFAWTRPIRIGGAQMQRNFGLRPDLVTVPLPAARGSAAVPSTADIYINNVKTFSQDVNTGPYLLSNLPAITGSGTARVILRDSAGHTTESVLPFYVSANLLAPGMFDYSVEAGLPRLSYGTTGDSYLGTPLASASARYGAFDWLTIMGHAEGGAGLMNGSLGAVIRTGSLGVATVAGAASRAGTGTGFQSYAAYETKLFGVSINASSQMTFGTYNDLASVTARLDKSISADPYDIGGLIDISTSVQKAANSKALFTSAQPPKMLNRISFGVPLPFYSVNLSAGFTQTRDAADVRSDIANVTVSFPVGRASFFATAFSTVSGEKNRGFLAGMSVPLGDVTTSLSVSGGTEGLSINADAVKPLEQKPGSWGWRVRDSEGVGAQRSAAVSYRSSFARTEAGVSQGSNGVVATAEVEGAVATMGGGVFFANRIDDAFAVVETGVPDVEVFHENRPAGMTNSSGRALIPGLRSYQRNKIAIDTTKLPVDADISTTEGYVTPADRSGVRLNFAVRTDVKPAIVVFKGADGQPLAAGARGQIEGGEDFIVGYDGRAYIKNLSAENKVTIAMVDRECRASFNYEARANEQVVISGVTCQ